ncbi:FAD-binding domain-containing protein [Parathielavia hyrcaniae]|uniref:FAD-binding domain-containing protein n=1 Tax=Parathielavia hyrcaniae TaxID=113614 RepID=A0AAN6PYS6_9PEZI|nr:FAD-binding domain-containing protein [Parathielavia hyrcaniae]
MPTGKNTGMNHDDFHAWVNPFNKARLFTPAAVVRPSTTEQVSGVVQCAAKHGVKVQARSDGHSYAFWEIMRAFAHGVCPEVGIGGHATIGGLGPMSRMWGATLDHILEVEVVTANGTIVRAIEADNAHLFWFVMKMHPKPTNTIHFTQKIKFAEMDKMAAQFQAWQQLIASPSLDHRFGTEFEINLDGAKLTGTYYGTAAEFAASGIPKSLPEITPVDNARLILSDVPTEFYSRSLGFQAADLLPPNATEAMFRYIRDQNAQADVRWFVIFDATGGAVAQVPAGPSAYAHRDRVMFYQSYAFNIINPLTRQAQNFLNGIHEAVLSGVPEGFVPTTYPRYVDPMLEDAQRVYWGANLERLERVKRVWDAGDVFQNPQSVRPAVEGV